MPSNVEIKARIPADALPRVRERAAKIASGPPRAVHQTDTFFLTTKGRLKLRDFGAGSGELIYYERPDQLGPKHSNYLRSDTPDVQSMRDALGRCLGIRGEVHKRREVFLVGQTRVHLDEVRALGTFLELEVVLEEGQSTVEGERIARALLVHFGIPDDALVAEAYIDLLEQP